MSRIAKKPLQIPTGVEFSVVDRSIHIKGKKGIFTHEIHSEVNVVVEGNVVWVRASNKTHPMVGTTCKLLGNMVKGVHEGFERKLQLVGVGYRAKIQGDILELSLGFSNPVLFKIPTGVSVEVPSNTEIVIRGIDKQIVGEIAAKIRAVRPPETYKGKGVRYFGEVIIVKETKKK